MERSGVQKSRFAKKLKTSLRLLTPILASAAILAPSFDRIVTPTSADTTPQKNNLPIENVNYSYHLNIPAVLVARDILGNSYSVLQNSIIEEKIITNFSSAKTLDQLNYQVNVTSPTNETFQIGTFLDNENTQVVTKFRFRPIAEGFYKIQVKEGDTIIKEYSINSVKSDISPNLKIDANKIKVNGSEISLNGLGDCLLLDSANQIKMGMDGSFRDTSGHGQKYVDLETYLKAYSDSRYNIFRVSVNNCSLDLNSINNQDVYDTMFQALKKYNFFTMMTVFNDPATLSPDQIKTQIKTAVDRYGAYVDFWELSNEANITDTWIKEYSSYLRSIDPYKRPISASVGLDGKANLDEEQYLDRHLYFDESAENMSARLIFESSVAKSVSGSKPIFFGEFGWLGQNYPENNRQRLRVSDYALNFLNIYTMKWNSSFAKDNRSVPANVYIGPDERADHKFMMDFFDNVVKTTNQMNVSIQKNDETLSVFSRTGTNSTGQDAMIVYAQKNGNSQRVSNFSLELDSPVSGVATISNPESGQILNKVNVVKGKNYLNINVGLDVSIVIK